MRYLDPGTDWVFDPACTLVGAARRTVLELGSGVGTAGLAAAHALHRVGAGHTTILTDLPEVGPLLRRNARAAKDAGMDVRVDSLPWGDAHAAAAVLRAAPRALTHILCSDLVYFPELLAPLLRTLLDVTQTDPSPEVVFGYKVRSLTKEQPFWTALGAWFEFQAVYAAPADRPTAWARLGSQQAHLVYAPAGSAADEYFVFVAHRKKCTLGQSAPCDDSHLLQGLRVVQKEPEEVYDEDMDGMDTFEWLLFNRTLDDESV